MRPASYVLSFCLHAALFLLFWFWPEHPPLRLNVPPVMISLVEGDPGGNRTPSPILGHMGEPGEASKTSTAPAPKAETASPERTQIKEPAPVPLPSKVEQAPVKKLDPVPEQKPALPQEKMTPVAPKKAPQPKQESKKEDKKSAQEKQTQPPKVDPVAAALEQARRKASSRADSGDRGNALEQALAQAQRKASGNRGGGGGESAGPGGGLGDVYIGQVMLAVRPNWGFASAARVNLSCVVRVKVDMQGKVLQTDIFQRSGNPQFDASAVNAVVRTGQAGQFPPPPSSEYTDLDIVFTLDELMGR
ncbi:protein TolA [Deltaproteobacteria bacterium]|nr:protein TolA [Deltaproteobacteria bacterium]